MPDVTVGANTYKSFISTADADTYLDGDISRAESWSGVVADNKARAVVSATRMLLVMPWCADPAPSPDDAPVDQTVADVTAMLAADLASNPELFADASGDSNIKVAKAGSAQVEFFAPIEGGPPIPRALWDRLLAADLVCLDASGDGDVIGGAEAFGISGSVRPLGGRWPWDWAATFEDYG